MKTLMRALMMCLLLVATHSQTQAADNSKYATVDIHTNAVCDDCQHRIQTEMLYVKGVQAVSVDLATNTIHVEYKAKKTDPEKLRIAVTKIGYMADNMMPDPKARKALPSCCQSEHCDMPGSKKAEAAKAAPAPVPAETPEPAATPEPFTPEQ